MLCSFSPLAFCLRVSETQRHLTSSYLSQCCEVVARVSSVDPGAGIPLATPASHANPIQCRGWGTTSACEGLISVS